jgi:ribonuclease T2
MRRGDAAVLSISAVLGAVVVAAVVFSVFVEDRPREPASTVAADSTSSLLVVTWGPSLCATDGSNPGCRSGHVGKLGPTLILHGLWPQPSTEQFCGISKNQRDGSLSSLNLPQAVQTDLQSKMSDVAIMAPHEWNAHGTCSGLAPPEYFSIAATLAEQASTALDPVFLNGGGRVSLDALRDRMDAEFGPGAGKRVSLTCRKVEGAAMVAYEVQLSLPPVVDLKSAQAPVALKDVITKGPPLSTGCRRGVLP